MSVPVFFQLIRWKNLLLGIFNLLLIKFILVPKFTEQSNFSTTNFVLFIFSIVLITAAGYIINDVYDLKNDLINKKSTIVGSIISTFSAKMVVVVFNVIGLGIGVLISYNANQLFLSTYFFMLVSLLFYYSKKLKSMALIGNITVALLISSSIFIFLFFENIPFNTALFKIILTYSLFAFLINLIREIVKDIEDIKGDHMSNLRTLPIAIGRNRTHTVLMGLSIILAILIVSVLVLYKEQNNLLRLYGFLFVLLPLLLFIYKLKDAKSKRTYHRLSLYLKLLMLLGILSIFVL